MRSTLVSCLIVFVAVGCHNNPLRVLMRGDVNGNVNMGGRMDVTGDTRVEGVMEMTGSLTSTIKSDNSASRLGTAVVEGDPSAGQSIALIDVDGLLMNSNSRGLGSMGENPVALFREKLHHLRSDPSIAAIVLRINSLGGGVTASDMMSDELRRFRDATDVPVVACLVNHGTGGAYFLATHADVIVAHPTSIVGGIGVILNLYSMEDALGQYNIAAIPVKSGDKIDSGTPVRPMERSERELLQSIADDFHQRFIRQVRTARNLPADEQWQDGRVFTGLRAAEIGLVDQVGYIDEAIGAAQRSAGLPASAPVVMMRRDNDRAYTVLDVTPNEGQLGSLIPLNVPGLDRSQLPTFMYLWQLEPSYATGR